MALDQFRQIVADLLRVRKMEARDLAKALGISPSHLSRLLHGTRDLAAEDGPAWCHALGLKGAEREGFLDEMHLAMTSPRVLRIIDQMRDELRLTTGKWDRCTNRMKRARKVFDAIDDDELRQAERITTRVAAPRIPYQQRDKV